MIIGFAGCRMTARDYRDCVRLMERLDADGSSLTCALREKLEYASIVEQDCLAPHVVAIGSRVVFSVDGANPESRRLLLKGAPYHPIGLGLPVGTPRGIALLGMRAGQDCRFLENGRQRQLVVHQVFSRQPPMSGRDTEPIAEDSTIIDLCAARNRRTRARACDPVQQSNPVQTKEIL